MLACATQHAIGWFWKQRQDRPHSTSLSPRTPKHYALSYIHLLWRLEGEGGHKYGEWRRETEIAAGEWESEQQTHRGPWRLPITLPRAAERERQWVLVPRRPSYTMRLQRQFYIMCPMERNSVQNLLSSSLLSKKLKIKIYRTIILPVVLYGYET